MTRGPGSVEVSTLRGPDVQLLGDAVVIRGRAAVDAHRLLARGYEVAQRHAMRDGISPPAHLVTLLSAMQLAAGQARESSTAVAEIAELRSRRVSASCESRQVIGVQEVARLFGVGDRQARHLASSLGGWRGTGRGRPWRFDAETVQAYLECEESK